MNLYLATVHCWRTEGHDRLRCVPREFIVAENIRDVAKRAVQIAEDTANSQPWVSFEFVRCHRLAMPMEVCRGKRVLKPLLVF